MHFLYMHETMKNTLIQIKSNGMGEKDEKLSQILIQKYFELISEEQIPPGFIVFYNEGVKLLCEGSPSLNALELLASKGTKLIACSTCLNYFNLADKQKTGVSGSMQDIISLQSKAVKVITL